MGRKKEIFLALGLTLASAAPMTALTFNDAQAASAEDLNKDASQAIQMLILPSGSGRPLQIANAAW